MSAFKMDVRATCNPRHKWDEENRCLVCRLPRRGSWERKVYEFWRFVDRAAGDGCWLWLGNNDGRYGVCDPFWGSTKAHRASWFLFNGLAIPGWLELDHTCKCTLCVNPDHLELVTHKENLHRAKPTCKKGHPLDGNRKIFKNGASRCLTCYDAKVALMRANYIKKKDRSA